MSISKEVLETILKNEIVQANRQQESFEEALWKGPDEVDGIAFRQARRRGEDGRLILKVIRRITQRITEETGFQLDVSPKPPETTRQEPK